jgi:nuclear GTP-binding protein
VIAFHASPNHSFGKGSLITLLRQFSTLHSDKKQISVGLIGYPNVGKSSVINTLKKSKVCTVAPVPGETKVGFINPSTPHHIDFKVQVWQYITLTRRIYLIDCPGIVPSSAASDSTTSTVLKGVVRVEALASPSEHIPTLLQRVRPVYLSRTYGIPLPEADEATQEVRWDPEEFLDKLARLKGRLLKGGEPDVEGVAKIVLSDWVRGRIPFFVEPPARPTESKASGGQAANDVKGTGKAVEKDQRQDGNSRELGVTQKLRGIMQKNTFINEDVREMEEAGVGNGDEREGVADEGEAEASSEDEEQEELEWADVFPEDGATRSKGMWQSHPQHDGGLRHRL